LARARWYSETCSLITTDANELAARCHDRISPILSNCDLWLDPGFQDREKLLSMLCLAAMPSADSILQTSLWLKAVDWPNPDNLGV
jgi:putative SOS response-associated peptidase YedK